MRISGEKGISAIAAVALMILISVMGLSVASLVTTSHTIKADQVLYDRSFYVTQAGLEYAMRKIYSGESPVVVSPGVSFSGGDFTVSRLDRLVTVTGNYQGSQVVHSVTSPSYADCTRFDLDNASVDGDKLKHIQFEKICLEQIVIDKMYVSWTNPGSEGLRKVRVENSTLYNNPPVLSGDLTELADYVLTGNQMNNMNYIQFTHDMEGRDVTVNFVMGDGSAESYTVEADDD